MNLLNYKRLNPGKASCKAQWKELEAKVASGSWRLTKMN